MSTVSNLHKKWPFWWVWLGVFALYLNTVGFDYNVDDDLVTKGNAFVEKGISGIPQLLTSPYVVDEEQQYGYRPITAITFAIEKSLFGFNAGLSHLINVLIYGYLCILLIKLAMALFAPQQQALSWAILLFIAHPTHVEVVCSLKNREELLMMLFSILSLLQFIRYVKQGKRAALGWSALWFALAVLTKLSAVYLVAVMPLTGFFLAAQTKNSSSVDSNTNYLPAPRPKPHLLHLIWLGMYLSFPFADAAEGFSTISGLLITFMPLPLFIAGFTAANRQESKLKALTYPVFWAFFIPWHAHHLLFNTDFRWPVYLIMMFSAVGFWLTQSGIKLYLMQPLMRVFKHKLVAMLGLTLALAFVILGIYYLQKLILPEEETVLLPNQNPLFAFNTFTNRLLMGGYTLWFYAKMSVFPHPLLFYYGQNTITLPSFSDAEVWLGFAVLVGILYAAFIAVTQRKWWAYWVVFWAASLVLFSNFYFPVTGIVGERLMFVSTWPFCMLVSMLGYELVQKFAPNFTRQKVLRIALFTPLLLGFTYKTANRIPDWKNYEDLLKADIETGAASVRVNTLYGANQYQKALAAKTPSEQLALAQSAQYHFKVALQFDSLNYNIFNNLGALEYNFFNRNLEAISYFEAALELKPSLATTRLNLIEIYLAQQAYDKATAHMLNYLTTAKTANVNQLYSFSQTLGNANQAQAVLAINRVRMNDFLPASAIIMAQVKYSLNEFDSALYFTNVALQHSPNNADAQQLKQVLTQNSTVQ